jgi:hypothetical protein
MFKGSLPTGGVDRDRFRQQASLNKFATKATSPEDMQKAMAVVTELVSELATVFEGFRSGSDIRFEMWSLIKSIAHGSWEEVIERAQRIHKDCHAVMFAEFGEVHSLFVCGRDPRVIRVTCLLTGTSRLLHMKPYSITLLHGRWAHGGLGLPGSERDISHYVFFAYVLLRVGDDSLARYVNYGLDDKASKMEEVLFMLTDVLAAEDYSSLDWTPEGTADM